VGLAVGSVVADLHGAAAAMGHKDAADLPGDLLAIIEAGPDAWALAEALDEALATSSLDESGRGSWWHPSSTVRFLPPLTPRKNPWVVGANYYQHMANGFARIPRPAVVPPHVEFFSKAITAIVGDGDDIVYDRRATVTVDYETELTVVIGVGGRDIPSSDGHDCVFGYTVCNDTSARELQLGHQQYFRGKSLDTFCPMGPVIATRRHVPSPYSLTIKTRVNGHLRQNWPVGDMLYKVDELVSVLSQGMTIEPGDMIVCGTVPGTGFEQLPQVWLQHGDVLESEITNIGVLTNTVRQLGVPT
jgi:2-keto-4-pentenoate hydratase/2-oxohepta-3-ene-1,7-dioic acid hydratase in catechol pathway